MGETTKEAGMTKELDQTHDAVLSADGAQLQEAIESVDWERRGLLQRLTRTRSAAEDEVQERTRGR
jgi:mRNA-degrading endonuclease toxin of MazEF toxin-antitoxin module